MKRLLTIFLIFTFTHTTAQVKSYTLEETIRIGLSKSKNVEISKSRLAYSKAQVREISSQRFAKLSFNASYIRLSDVPAFEINVPFYPQPIKIQDPILDTYSLKLSLRQPLFTGFKLSSLYSAAEYNSKSAQLEYSQAHNDEASRIINAFWNVYKLENKIKIIDERLKGLEAHLSDANNFMENGLITNNDVLKIEVQYSSLKLNRLEVDNALKIAKGVLNQMLGNPINDKLSINSEEIIIDKSIMHYDDLLKQAQENRLELKSMDYKLKASNNQVSTSSSGWYPSIYLFSDFYYSRPNQRIFPQRDQFDDSWDIGISLNWDIWDWGYTSSLSQKAESNFKIIKTNHKQLLDKIELEVYHAYMNYQSAIEKINVSKSSLKQAEENYRITNDKYSVQLVTTTDLLDAEADLLDAKVKLLNAKIDYELSKVNLKKAIGEKLY